MTTTVTPTHRPTLPGTVVAVGAGLVAVGLLVDTAAQWQALLVELAGIGLVGAGYAARDRSRVGGTLLALVGAGLVLTALGLALTDPSTVANRLELLPGMVGLALLLAGLLPVRSGRERALLTLGTALLFVGVVTSGVVRGSTLPRLLVASIATVLAWDAGDNAISLGRQAGRQARTYRAELTHAGATVLVGASVVAGALAIEHLDVQGLSLTGFAALLVAGFALVLALRH